MEISFEPLGDRGVRIGFPEIISPEVNREIRAFAYALEKEEIIGIVEIVPTYVAISVYYEPKDICYRELLSRLEMIKEKLQVVELPTARLIEIPVLYGGQGGPDLNYVAEAHELTVEQVIDLHTSRPYLVYMLGFAPGFPYLGGLSEAIATPRLTNPRPKIPGGSVGIGGMQTGIYPLDAPGGWQIIGHTPVKMYDPQRAEPVFLRAGDYLQFVAIQSEVYQQIRVRVERGEYQVQIKTIKEDEQI